MNIQNQNKYLSQFAQKSAIYFNKIELIFRDKFYMLFISKYLLLTDHQPLSTEFPLTHCLHFTLDGFNQNKTIQLHLT